MKHLFSMLALFCSIAGFVKGDPNIYGPDGVNLGPNGNPELYLQESEQQKQNIIDADESKSELTIYQQRNGNYLINGSINNFPLDFVIDTGASVVALPRKIALSAGIDCEKDTFVETANGKVPACTGKITKLAFGDFTISDLQCVIIPNLNQALLGNNALKMFKIVQNNDVMKITKKPND